jgi:hypothetical protein
MFPIEINKVFMKKILKRQILLLGNLTCPPSLLVKAKKTKSNI